MRRGTRENGIQLKERADEPDEKIDRRRNSELQNRPKPLLADRLPFGQVFDSGKDILRKLVVLDFGLAVGLRHLTSDRVHSQITVWLVGELPEAVDG
ncbi:hypothetical protein EGH25_03920 [Haladaptatus sp. F3-133]|jgi:hypothetical protein|uniref:Uncharacterized protein n=1 Tax=Halorutilus salinus TaxID=2487751 RepID=A0A9Q4C3P4_9EURY|nr:hypothetical protein [Halorutilus salinus]MCX2818501.1 hypothetical protein [Halorutilus salinus]